MSPGAAFTSFARYPAIPQKAVRMHWRSDPFPNAPTSLLPRGYGRSYGDSCLAPADGCLIDIRCLDHLIAFDATTGILRCESGVAIDTILRIFLPQGWLPCVLPGTSQVTVGGAIANDVHGKNHHRRGSFGDSVLRFELLRSDGSRRICSPAENADLFTATIGGLGLTGIITWAEIALRQISSSWLDIETLRFADLDEFFTHARDSETTHEYTVAWFDCLSAHDGKLRGVFFRANHSAKNTFESARRIRLRVPFTPPFALCAGVGLRAFNVAYYTAQRPGRRLQHCLPFFFPLDAVRDWNRLYGPRGFVQFQCVVPPENARNTIATLLDRIALARKGSFLAVLKTFGDRISRGLLGFPRPGTTLALDFPANSGVLALLSELDDIVIRSGGAIYPAKDARMSAAAFRTGFPRWETVEALRDPAILSAFWQRVTAPAT